MNRKERKEEKKFFDDFGKAIIDFVVNHKNPEGFKLYREINGKLVEIVNNDDMELITDEE